MSKLNTSYNPTAKNAPGALELLFKLRVKVHKQNKAFMDLKIKYKNPMSRFVVKDLFKL